MLTGLAEVPICVAYEINGERLDDMPMTQTDFTTPVPIYEELDGWCEDITKARTEQSCRRTASATSRDRGD